MRVIAVPVKSLERAKSRLSEVLTPLERAALTLAMLEDVLDACLPQPGWQTWVVSPDESVLEVSARRRARPVVEGSPGLLAAVRQVEEEAAGADALAVVLGDLPLLTAEALERVLQTLGPVVADLRGTPFAEVRSPELAYDLDRPEDIPAVLSGRPGRTRAACLEMGLADRLSASRR
jgi:2-phospho-L-lactate guanylyltransferase